MRGTSSMSGNQWTMREHPVPEQRDWRYAQLAVTRPPTAEVTHTVGTAHVWAAGQR